MIEADLEAAWLTELGHDLRARRDAEYLYTAAAVALFGGVAWGVAGPHGRAFYILTIVGVLAVVIAVAYKIRDDLKNYITIWNARTELFKRLSKRAGADEIFRDIINKKPGQGYVFSIWVLAISALLPGVSCILGFYSN
jgi:hypothetical protein